MGWRRAAQAVGPGMEGGWGSLQGLREENCEDLRGGKGVGVGGKGVLKNRFYYYLGMVKAADQETLTIKKIVCYTYRSQKKGQGTP